MDQLKFQLEATIEVTIHILLKKNNNPYAKPSPSKCFRCNEPRHQSKECPKRKSVNVVEMEEETCDHEVLCGPDDEDNGNDFEHEVYTCVVRKLMLS